jgi:hypothetical protein
VQKICGCQFECQLKTSHLSWTRHWFSGGQDQPGNRFARCGREGSCAACDGPFALTGSGCPDSESACGSGPRSRARNAGPPGILATLIGLMNGVPAVSSCLAPAPCRLPVTDWSSPPELTTWGCRRSRCTPRPASPRTSSTSPPSYPTVESTPVPLSLKIKRTSSEREIAWSPSKSTASYSCRNSESGNVEAATCARLGETGPLSQGVQARRKALRIRHINGTEACRKRPRGVKKEAQGVQVSPLNPLAVAPWGSPSDTPAKFAPTYLAIPVLIELSVKCLWR